MLRYISLFVFVLSVFITPKLSAQWLQKTLPKDVLLKALKHPASDSAREGILLELCRYHLLYSTDPDGVDSASYYLNIARQYAVKQNRFLQDRTEILSAGIRNQHNQAPDASDIYMALIKKFQENGDKINEAFAWVQSARSFRPNEKNDSLILVFYQHARQLAMAVNDLQAALDWQTSIAVAHVGQHKYDLAERELLYVINHPKANTEDLLDGSDKIAQLYVKKGIFDKALFYALKSERLMETSNDSTLAINYFDRLSSIYIILGKLDEGIYWSTRALNHCLTLKRYKLVYKISNSIVQVYLQMHKTKEATAFLNHVNQQYKPATLNDKRIFNLLLGNIYTTEKNYPLAEKYYLQMNRFASQEPEGDITTDERAIADHKLAKIYALTGQFKKAKLYIDKSLVYGNTYGGTGLLNMIHGTAFKVDSALGLYPSAIRHLQITQMLYDSIFNISRNKQIEALQIAFQTEKKEKDIAVLKGLEKQQNIKLLRSENAKNLIITGACLLAIIIALLFRQNRIRRKNNQIMVQKNEHLEQLISEKNWLLKEVHHRVKNNLHTVICLLESQANYLESDALKAIETSQHRIYAMSLIHQKLYQSDDIKTIDMQDYIGELVSYLKDSFGPIENIDIRFVVQPIKLGATHAIPLGLIINEAVTNAIQHAFPKNANGKIDIKLKRSEDNITLLIEDNGIGIGYNVHESETESLGIELIKGLAKELKGNVFFNEKEGTSITIAFSLDPLESIISQAIHLQTFAGQPT